MTMRIKCISVILLVFVLAMCPLCVCAADSGSFSDSDTIPKPTIMRTNFKRSTFDTFDLYAGADADTVYDVQLSVTLNYTFGQSVYLRDIALYYGNVIFSYWDAFDSSGMSTTHSQTETIHLYLSGSSLVNGAFMTEIRYMINTEESFSYQASVSYNLISCEPVASSASDQYQSGYNAGFAAGESSGYGSGYETGKTEGYESGYQAGVDSVDTDEIYKLGYDAGYNTGYSAGYTAGYEAGLSAANDLGDPGELSSVSLYYNDTLVSNYSDVMEKHYYMVDAVQDTTYGYYTQLALSPTYRLTGFNCPDGYNYQGYIDTRLIIKVPSLIGDTAGSSSTLCYEPVLDDLVVYAQDGSRLGVSYDYVIEPGEFVVDGQHTLTIFLKIYESGSFYGSDILIKPSIRQLGWSSLENFMEPAWCEFAGVIVENALYLRKNKENAPSNTEDFNDDIDDFRTDIEDAEAQEKELTDSAFANLGAATSEYFQSPSANVLSGASFYVTCITGFYDAMGDFKYVIIAGITFMLLNFIFRKKGG